MTLHVLYRFVFSAMQPAQPLNTTDHPSCDGGASIYCTWPFVAAERNRLTLSMCSAEQRIHCLKECLCIEPRSTLNEFYNNLFQATRLVSQYPSSHKAGVFHLQHLLYRGQFSQLACG